MRDSAQILIRNADTVQAVAPESSTAAGDPHVAALVRLVRAMARREPLPGYAYAIHTGLASRLDGRDRLPSM